MTIGLGIVIALCGVCVGILSAMFGIGGGIVMVPEDNQPYYQG